MIVYPAIDLRNGKCVRLLQGEFDKESVYGENPVEMALKWQGAGGAYLHMVDLDGAKSGIGHNLEVVRQVCAALTIPVQLGGGIRTLENVEQALQAGVARVILGTAAVKNPDFVREALIKYGSRIVIGIDAKDGYAAVEGWVETSTLRAVEFGKHMEALGAKTIIYTDIARDGMMTGPNLEAMAQMVQAVSIDVIASGGVSSLEDMKKLRETGVSGVITGKALYLGAFTLEEAITAAVE